MGNNLLRLASSEKWTLRPQKEWGQDGPEQGHSLRASPFIRQADTEQTITVLCLKLYQSSLQVSMGGVGQSNRTLDTRGEMGESLRREGRLE